MYRFLLTPRWLAFHLLVIAAIVAMVNLGFWQLRRLDERQAFNDAVASRIDVPPEPLADVVTPSAPTRTASSGGPSRRPGTYLPDEQFVVVNRSQGGIAGDLVVTPMRSTTAASCSSQRGFVPARPDRRAGAGGRRSRSSAACASRSSGAAASSATGARAS